MIEITFLNADVYKRQLDIFDEEAFEKSGVPFYVTVTNLSTGKAEYHKVDNVFEQMELLRASSALPLASKIVEWQGNKYLDGGLSDSIPVDFAKSLGFDKLIVVLTRPIAVSYTHLDVYKRQ